MNPLLDRALRSYQFGLLGIALLAGITLGGCGGGSNSGGGSSSGGGGGTTTTTDMGTLTTMGDTNTYTFKNSASALVLGISRPEPDSRCIRRAGKYRHHRYELALYAHGQR